MTRLTEAQAGILAYLARRDALRDGALSGPEIGRALGHRLAGWAAGKLVALESRGFVERLGTTFSSARCWRITPAGRTALAQAQDDGGSDA